MLALIAQVSVAGAEDIRIVESRQVTLERDRAGPDASHELRLFLYVFENGRWGKDAAKAVLEAARLLRQCGVALLHAELKVVEAPGRFRHYFTPASGELARRLRAAKPAIFFVDGTLNDPAYDAEAIGRANAATRPELADTVWVAHGARDLPQALAHELVHVLSDSGEHSDEPGNLMRTETSRDATRLSSEQCSRLRARGEANGLLQRTLERRR